MVDSAKPKAEPWYPFGSGPPVAKQVAEQPALAPAPAAIEANAKPPIDFPAGSTSMLSTAQANALPPFGPDAPSFINEFLRGNSEPAFGRQVSIAAGDKSGVPGSEQASTSKPEAVKPSHVHVHPPVPPRTAFGELLHAEAKEINRANGVVNSAVTQGLAVDAIKAVVELKLQGHAKDIALNLVAGAEDLPAISAKLAQSQKIAGAIQSAAAKAEGPEQATALATAKLRGNDGAVASSIIASVAGLQQDKAVAEVSKSALTPDAAVLGVQAAAVAGAVGAASQISAAMPAALGGAGLAADAVEQGVMAGVAAAVSQELAGGPPPGDRLAAQTTAVETAAAAAAPEIVSGAGALAGAGVSAAVSPELAGVPHPVERLAAQTTAVETAMGATAGALGAIAAESAGNFGSEPSPASALSAGSAMATGVPAAALSSTATVNGTVAAEVSAITSSALAGAGAALGSVAADSVSRVSESAPGVVPTPIEIPTTQAIPEVALPSFAAALPPSAMSNMVGADALAAAYQAREASIASAALKEIASEKAPVVQEKQSTLAIERDTAASQRTLAPVEDRSTFAVAEKALAAVEDRSTSGAPQRTFAPGEDRLIDARDLQSASAALAGQPGAVTAAERFSDSGAKGLLDAASSVMAAVSGKAGDMAQHGVSKAEATVAGAAEALSSLVTSASKPDARVSLEQALAAHMREKGFDNQSVGAASAIAAAVGRDSHGADLRDAVLVLHKEGQKGDPLATVVSAKDVNQIRQPGDSVLALDTLEKIASRGLDTAAVQDLRGHASENVRSQSDLELSQSTGQAKSAIQGLEQLQAPERQAVKQEKAAEAEQRDTAMSM